MKQAALLFLLVAAGLQAEAPGSVDAKVSFGTVAFEDQEYHVHLGGSVRYYVTRRFSVEPEFQFFRGSSGHSDVLVIPNVNWDFREGRVVPYVTAGFGWMRSNFPQFRPSFSTNDGLLQAGAGVKLYPAKNWFVAPELRVGSELHARWGMAIGYTFRR